MENCFANWPLILEYLKVFLSWPPLIAVVLIVFFRAFKLQIGSLIDRIRTFEGLGTRVEIGDLGVRQERSDTVPTPPAAGDVTVALTGVAATAQAGSTRAQAEVSGPETQTPLEKLSADPELAKAEILKWWSAAKFESVLNRIFGTQLRLLGHLSQHPGGETLANLSPYYLEHKELASAGGLQPAPLASYVSFLTTNELVRLEGSGDNQRAVLTMLGQQFLQYVLAHYTNWHKPW